MGKMLLNGLFLVAGIVIGVALQIYREFFMPFSIDKIGDAASVISAAIAALTLCLGVYVARKWRANFLFEEQCKSLDVLGEKFNKIMRRWSDFGMERFSPEGIDLGSVIGKNVKADLLRRDWNEIHIEYSVCWEKSNLLGCVREGSALDPGNIKEKFHTLEFDSCGEMNSEMRIDFLLKSRVVIDSSHSDGIVELKKSFEKLIK